MEKVFSYYTSASKELAKRIEWVDAELTDIYSLLNVLDGVEYIYHCAAMVSFEAKHQAEMMLSNMEGTTNLVNAALTKNIKKFC